MKETVVALFESPDDAHYAVQDLLHAGFARDVVGVALHDPHGNLHEAHTLSGTLAAPTAAAGAGSGTMIGGLLGLIVGVSLIFAGLPGVLLIGPAAWIAAGAATGAASGGIIGFLVGQGIPRERAEAYAYGLDRGGTLVSVEVNDRNRTWAEQILSRDGAEDVVDEEVFTHRQTMSGHDSELNARHEEALRARREALERLHGSDHKVIHGLKPGAPHDVDFAAIDSGNEDLEVDTRASAPSKGQQVQ